MGPSDGERDFFGATGLCFSVAEFNPKLRTNEDKNSGNTTRFRLFYCCCVCGSMFQVSQFACPSFIVCGVIIWVSILIL